MPVNVNNITQLCQRAAQLYLQQAGLSTINAERIYKGLDREYLKLPRAVCQCKSANMDLNFDGIWMAELAVLVRSQGDDSEEEEHFLRASEIHDCFMTTTINSDLSSVLAGFSASMVMPRTQSWDITGDDEGRRTWVSELVMEIRCTGGIIEPPEFNGQISVGPNYNGLMVGTNEDGEPTIYLSDNGTDILERLGVNIYGAGFKINYATGNLALWVPQEGVFRDLLATTNEDGVPTPYLGAIVP